MKTTDAGDATTPPGPDEPPKPQALTPDRRRRTVGWQSKDVVRAAALVIGMYLLLKLLWFVNALVLAGFLGVLFGLALSTGVDRLERFRIPRGIGATLITVAFLGVLVGMGAWMTPTLRQQSRELRVKLPQAVDRVEGWLNKRGGGLLGTLLGVRADSGPGGATSADTASADTTRADTATLAGADTVGIPPGAPGDTTVAPSTSDRLRDRLGQQVSGAGRYLFPFLSQTAAVIAGILLILFMAIYIAVDPNTYHRGLMHMFPHRSRERAGEVLSAIATVLRRWLVTQLIAMVVIGVVTTVVLLILRVEAAFALGLLAGLLEFIPTVGPILSAVPAVAMGILDSPEKALIITAAYVGIQFIENQLLIPLLMKDGVGVPPVLTIVGQALMTLLFGFLGLLVAVPVLAAAMVAVKMLWVEGVVGDDVDVITTDDGG